jgi:hypothetical protein
VFCTDAQIPPCNPTDSQDTLDMAVEVSLSDAVCLTTAVGCAGPGADYVGRFVVYMPGTRITDHSSDSSQGSTCPNLDGAPPCVPATAIDTQIAFPGQCVDNGGPNGGVCSLNTTLDSAVPGAAIEGQRAVFAIRGQVGYPGSFSVANAGANPDIGFACPPICGSGDEEPMAWSGLFLP